MRFKALPNIALPLLLAIAAWLLAATSATASAVSATAAWTVFETSIETTKAYARPFVDVEVDAIFEKGDTRWRVPAFWSGGGTWKVRFAPPEAGEYRYRFVSNDPANADFAAPARTFVATPATGDNPLHRRGFLRVSDDSRHFEHADGTPFLWLGDTWWKGLCKRIDLDGFESLCADRAAKGFNVVQIVCGPYPDENMLEPRWENEAGMPYTTLDFTAVNPAYFDAADTRIAKLIAHGIVPAIVGGWGRPQGGVNRRSTRSASTASSATGGISSRATARCPWSGSSAARQATATGRGPSSPSTYARPTRTAIRSPITRPATRAARFARETSASTSTWSQSATTG
jgi:hypothetical protein